MGRPNQNSKWKAGQQPDPVFVTDTAPKKSTPVAVTKSVSEAVESPTIDEQPVEVVDVKQFKKIKKNEE